MGNDNVIGVYWKINGENKWFKPEGGNQWGEYDNGRKVFSFQLVSQNGQNVTLRKTDGSILHFDNNRVTIEFGGSGPRHLYNGSWQQSNNDDDDKDVYEQPQQTYYVQRSSGG